MTNQAPPPLSANPLAIINQLIIKAFRAPSAQSLIFIITNDTHEVLKFDRAILWEIKKNKMTMLGISGQTSISPYAEINQKMTQLLSSLVDPQVPRLLNVDSFSNKKESWNEVQQRNAAAVLWLPIFVNDKLSLGLWIERWNVTQMETPPAETMNLLTRYLLPGYGAAWGRFNRKINLKPAVGFKKRLWLAIPALLIGLFLTHVPLRVVAPCEVVPDDPFVITAPLEGIIEQVIVNPGDSVKKGDPLFDYDKTVPLQELKVAEKEVEIMQAEVNRSLTLGIQDKNSLNELAILKLKLAKEKVNLELAKYHATLLTVTAPEDGIAYLDDPDEWRGRPVRIGEKVLTISDPDQTKIKIWVPENDNIELNLEEPIKILLNINPEQSRDARLVYIANETTLSDKQVHSFIAEAHWLAPQTGIKPGLKGTAILYGQKVSLFYYLFRRPWAFIRNTIGL